MHQKQSEMYMRQNKCWRERVKEGDTTKREQMCEQTFDITLAVSVNYYKTHTFTFQMQVVLRGPATITTNLLTK